MSANFGFIRFSAAADYLGIAPRTLREWLRRRLVRCHRPTARTILFTISDLNEAMSRFKSGGDTGGSR